VYLNRQNIQEIQAFCEVWKPSHCLVLNFRAGIVPTEQQWERAAVGCLHRIQRWCFPRRPRPLERVSALGWVETGEKSQRLHLHLLAHIPPPSPSRPPFTTSTLARAWRGSARSIAAECWTEPPEDATAWAIYSQKQWKGGGNTIIYR
jgi:hypothetical protein